MHWSDGLAIVIGCGFLYIIIRSITLQVWRNTDAPLRGKQKAAQEWLEANGYKVLKVRERGRFISYYDSRAFEKQIIADFIVRHAGKLYAVKVQNAREQSVSGQRLRSDWYPLFAVLGVDGILHIDLERDEVHVIDFDVKSPSYVTWRKVTNRSLWFLSGVLIALAWFHRQ
jgi:hypothetical protein